MKTYRYSVNQRHSSVLGYGAMSKTGATLWDELDWRLVHSDGGRHLLNPAGGEYLHVAVNQDNWEQRGGRHRFYRVRCLHEIGSRWRGGVVVEVRAEKKNNGWRWVVEVEK